MTWRGPCQVRVVTLRRPRRLEGFSYVGFNQYSLRFCTYERRRLFTASEHVEAAQSQIQRTADIEGFEILAYCFMPDHVHLLIEGRTPAADLRRAVKLMKQRSAYVLRIRFGVRMLWQDGYYERVLRDHEQASVVIRYFYENPVRAGLVERYQDYPYLGGRYVPDWE